VKESTVVQEIMRIDREFIDISALTSRYNHYKLLTLSFFDVLNMRNADIVMYQNYRQSLPSTSVLVLL
jgi:hypothetical protein